MSFDLWSAAYVSDNDLTLDSGSEVLWKEWARRVRDETNLDVPDPEYFEDWRSWVVALYNNTV